MSHVHLPKGVLAQPERFLVAVATGDAKEAESLIQQLKMTGRGDPTHVKDDHGLYPLHIAAAQGHEAVCRVLIKHGARVNQRMEPTKDDVDEKRTCLHYAAMSGNYDCIKYLFTAGAEPHVVDAFGKKPYMLCRNQETREFLQIAMESSTNILIAADLLVKACMAQLLVLQQPSTNFESKHPKRLVTTYDTWAAELAHIRKENGVNIPMPKPPKPSFLRSCRNNLRIGHVAVVDRRAEVETMHCFAGIIHAVTIQYLGEESLEIVAFYVRHDMRRTRMGTLLMYHLLTKFAKDSVFHAVASIADSNHAAQTFFRKMGFRSLLPDAVPAGHRKPLHTFFEVRNIGANLSKMEHYLDHYKDVKVIDDDDHLEDERLRVTEARARRIHERNQAKREARNSEQGAAFLQLEKSLGLHGEHAMKIERGDEGSGNVRWWLKDPPVPQFHKGKQIPLIYLPEPPELMNIKEPYLPPLPPAFHGSLNSPGNSSFKRVASDASESLPTLGKKNDESNTVTPIRLTTELDRVPEHVLKQYERDVLFHRDMATNIWRVAQRNDMHVSKIMQHKDPTARSDYLSEFEHYQECYTMKRNLFPEGIVGARPKPRFGIESVESPSWNRGTKKAGMNFTGGRQFTEGRQSRSKNKYLDDNDCE